MRRFFMLLVFCWCAALCYVPALALAAADGPTAELDPREIYLGQSLMLRVTIPGEATAVISVPALADWTVVPRGRVHGLRGTGGDDGEPVTAYRFELVPRRAGTLAVPALRVETDGKTFDTAPLTALVRPRPTPPKALAGRDILLDAVLSRPEPYAGEAFVYTLRLYRSVPATGIRLAPPRFPDMDVVPLPGQRDGEIEAHGRHYAVTEADYLLTAAAPGQFRIPPAAVVCQGVPGKGGAVADVTAKGPETPVTVRPLPAYAPGAGGAPFTGLVGAMRLAARLLDATPGREAVYELMLSGRGNLEQAAPPAVPAPSGCDVRFLEAQSGGDTGRSGFVGQRVFRYAVSADRPGNYALGPVRLAVFDPATGRYATIAAPELTLHVPASPAAPADPSLAPPLRHQPGARNTGLLPWSWRLVLALLPPVAYGLTFVPRGARRSKARAAYAGSPTALAEVLRDRLARTEAEDTEAAPAAVAALRRLDAVLYGSGPVDAAARGAAVDAAVRALRELGA